MAEDFDRDKALDVVRRYNQAFMDRDLAGMKACMTEDFIQWHSHIRKDFTRDEEFALLETVLDALHIVFHDARLTLTDQGVVQQVLADIKMANGAEGKNIPFAMVYYLRGDKICRCDEYVDGASLPKMDFLPDPVA